MRFGARRRAFGNAMVGGQIGQVSEVNTAINDEIALVVREAASEGGAVDVRDAVLANEQIDERATHNGKREWRLGCKRNLTMLWIPDVLELNLFEDHSV
ncbi:MAG: hypothetical protein ABI823_02595 [Bryobacteraceae bacterium]